MRPPTKHVYYSVTTDNPFLPPEYIEQLKRDMDPQMARRMLYGEWISIAREVVYYAYDKSRNYRDMPYVIDANFPIHVAWDFNIGEGKPLSVCFFQYTNDSFHFFNEVVVHGFRTQDALDEMAGRGLLDHPVKYIINGDATGKARSTKSIKSDYDIIREFFSNYRNSRKELLNYEMQVPLSNPPVRKRHNLVNAYCINERGAVRLFVYKDAKTVDEGLRLTQLKKGADYIEDDSKEFQHITTALGYGICSTIANETVKPTRSWSL